MRYLYTYRFKHHKIICTFYRDRCDAPPVYVRQVVADCRIDDPLRAAEEEFQRVQQDRWIPVIHRITPRGRLS